VFTLVRRARRRLLHNELFSQGANAGSAILAAFILLLLLGTEVLNWKWLLLIPTAAVVVGLYAVRRRLATPYAAAQLVDRRLGLADTISTAFHFHETAARGRGLPEIIELQKQAAERAAESADVRLAVPYRMPRAAYGMAALVLVAGSLFALRYAVSRSLDLKPPLVSILQQSLSPERKQQARNDRRRLPRPQTASQGQDQASDEQDAQAGDPQDSNSDQNQEDIADQQQAKADSKEADGVKKQEQEGQQTDGDPQDGDDRNGNNADSDSSQQGDGKQDSKQNSSRQDANNSADNNSLMSKVKDAVQNLLSKMKPQQNQSAGQQQSGEQNSQQGKGQQNGGKQQSAKNGQQQNGQQSDAQEGQSGDQAENSQDPQGKGTGNSDAKQASKQPGSGIGSQDGDKAIRQAEQLAAMGKISELIGKRAQNISGETTVEVKSTSQVLKTPYAQRGVQHSQSGGEISRDEIPVALQTYVENYFEQVRKQAPPPAKK
jgi:hypothetical protein